MSSSLQLTHTAATRFSAGWNVTDSESCAIASNIEGFACEVAVKCAPLSAIAHLTRVAKEWHENIPSLPQGTSPCSQTRVSHHGLQVTLIHRWFPYTNRFSAPLRALRFVESAGWMISSWEVVKTVNMFYGAGLTVSCRCYEGAIFGASDIILQWFSTKMKDKMPPFRRKKSGKSFPVKVYTLDAELEFNLEVSCT